MLNRLKPAQTVVLPRTPEQRAELGDFIVPERAIDAQSLMAYADIVVSAGGTMNREAVALGTPVWTTFEGRLGAVDEALIADGRLRRLERAEDLELAKRDAAVSVRTRRDPAVLADLLLSPIGGLPLLAARANRILRMRRRIRSAALPVHRHALPQVALDAGLVALAYFLAYRLRFDGGVPTRYEDLFSRTITFAICGSVATFALFGLYRHWMRYSSQREYLQIAQAVAVRCSRSSATSPSCSRS